MFVRLLLTLDWAVANDAGRILQQKHDIIYTFLVKSKKYGLHHHLQCVPSEALNK